MKKRSVLVSGHPTSVTIEAPFWEALKALSIRDGVSINCLISQIDTTREPSCNLSSAIRLHVLEAALSLAPDFPNVRHSTHGSDALKRQ